MSSHWYTLHVKPHKEPAVYYLLNLRGIEVYYPVLKVNPVNPRSRKERPFFPGYMFVKVDLDVTGAETLRWTEGTYGVVQFADEPTIVPEKLIEDVKEHLIKYSAELAIQKPEFEKGDKVRIVNGLFEGYDAIFDMQLSGNDRVQVLLAYLNQQPKRIILGKSDIKKNKR